MKGTQGGLLSLTARCIECSTRHGVACGAADFAKLSGAGTVTFDSFGFLDPWSVILPDRFPCVLAVAGRGAKSTLLRRLAREYQTQERRVMSTRSSVGPALSAPGVEELPPVHAETDLHALARQEGADVVLVEAQASCGSDLWPEGPPPDWPADTDLAFSTVSLRALGRRWGPEVVHAAPSVDSDDRRVEVADLLGELAHQHADRGRIAGGAAWIPFLAGFGALRDIDAMFSMGAALVEDQGARIVCFGELVGDERRDAADKMGISGSPAAADFLSGARIFAIHPESQSGPPDALP